MYAFVNADAVDRSIVYRLGGLPNNSDWGQPRPTKCPQHVTENVDATFARGPPPLSVDVNVLIPGL